MPMNPNADFRSDTFTLPDEAMRRAIYQAEVDNSAYGEDPSVNELESTWRSRCRTWGLATMKL